MRISKSLVKGLASNSLAVIFSVLLLQLYFLPELYKNDTLLYDEFTSFFYPFMTFISVINTMSYNLTIIKAYKISNSDVNFIYFFISFIVFIIVSIISSILYSSFELFLFSMLLFLVDLVICVLRLERSNKFIMLFIFMNSLLISLCYFVTALPYESYIYSSLFSLLFFILFFFQIKKQVYFLNFSSILDGVKLGGVLYSGVPTLNKYIDKIFVITAIIAASGTKLMPFILTGGLISFPMNIISKVIMRETSAIFTIELSLRHFFILIVFLLISSVLLFSLTCLIYDLSFSNSEYLMFAFVVSTIKMFNVIETLIYSSHKYASSDSKIVKGSLCLSLLMITCLGVLKVFGVKVSILWFSMVLLYSSAFPYIQYKSLKGR